MRLIVTGFGPFGDVTENPSSLLAERSGQPFQILEVAFDAVDEALRRLVATEFDALLMIGVAAGATRHRLEIVGRNFIGSLPDVRGVVAGPGLIDPQSPFQIHATLWASPDLPSENDASGFSHDAGGYLCNYALFQAIRRFPDKRVGFLHVPRFEAMSQERQMRSLNLLIGAIKSEE